MDNFKDAPPTIGEVRSDRSDSPADWSPRDALVTMLRDIDSGKITPDTMVIFWRDSRKPVDGVKFYNVAKSAFDTAGLISEGEFCIWGARVEKKLRT